MSDETDPIPVVFYRTSAGSEPVREWLKELPQADRQKIGQDLMRLQFRWPVGMPLCRPLGKGLWEVRTSLGSRREARVLFCHQSGTLVVLHGFMKKTQATPASELDLATRRQKEVQDGNEE